MPTRSSKSVQRDRVCPKGCGRLCIVGGSYCAPCGAVRRKKQLERANRPCPGFGVGPCGRVCEVGKTRCYTCVRAYENRVDRPCPGFAGSLCTAMRPPRRRYCDAHEAMYKDEYYARERRCYGVNGSFSCGNPVHGRNNRCTKCRRDYQLKIKFGLSRSDYDAMLASQRGACAICARPSSVNKKRFAVDHDHATGQVRALLCANCNTLIGSAHESVEVLQRAIEYLQKWKANAEAA